MTRSSAEYMRRYMRDYRQRLTGRISLLDVSDEAERERLRNARARRDSINRQRHRPGFCALCGHLSPDPTCPICVAELNGQPGDAAAWEVILATPIR